MILSASLILTTLIGLGLMTLSLWMFAVPKFALRALSRMGGSAPIHFGELGLRAVAGSVLLVAAPETRFPLAMPIIGAFLIASAVILMVLPRRRHAAYSTWWAARIPVWGVRILAPVSLVAGGVLIWTAI